MRTKVQLSHATPRWALMFCLVAILLMVGSVVGAQAPTVKVFPSPWVGWISLNTKTSTGEELLVGTCVDVYGESGSLLVVRRR